MTQRIDLDGQALIANCAPQFDAAAHSMLQTLAQRHRTGPALKPGSLIDFAWSLLQIQAHPGHWVVCEPDYDTDPLSWKPQVDDTVRVLQQQIAIRALVGDEPAERTRGDHRLLVQPGAFTAAEVYLHRSPPSDERDSGWYIGVENAPADSAGEKGQAMIAGRLQRLKPAWLTVLALPRGWLVHFEHDRLSQVHDAAGLQRYPR